MVKLLKDCSVKLLLSIIAPLVLALGLISPVGMGALAQTTITPGASPILVLGDSLSAEYGLSRGAGWVALLEAKLQQTNIKRPVINASISGDTTSGGLSRLPALLEKHRPGIVVIELGANDALRGLALEMTQKNLATMTSLSQQKGAKVLLLGMQLPPNFGNYAKQFAGLYTQVATTAKTSLVPFLLEGFGEKPEFFQADRIHPTAAAQPLMLANVWPVLEPLLKQKR
jgi:acyl-CoA thioesterase I